MEIKTKELDNGHLIINEEFAELIRHNGLITAKKLWEMKSDPVKNILEERGTGRFFLEPPKGSEFAETYIKRYTQPSLKEKIKAFSSLKFTKHDAFHEWNALLAFHRRNLPTVIPIAVARVNGRSCNLTLGIKDYKRASEIFASFKPEAGERKRRLIKKIADLAGDMHAAGFAHQDFYLVHIFVRECDNDAIYLIDLQRLVMNAVLSRRYRTKDLGELLFSARPFISRTDMMRFWKVYTEKAGKDLFKNKRLIRSVFAKADKILKRFERKNRSRVNGKGR